MNTAIITGSEGQLGQFFVLQLKRLGYQVIGIDLADQANDEIIYYQADITKKSEIDAILTKHDENISVLINMVYQLLNILSIATKASIGIFDATRRRSCAFCAIISHSGKFAKNNIHVF